MPSRNHGTMERLFEASDAARDAGLPMQRCFRAKQIPTRNRGGSLIRRQLRQQALLKDGLA